MPISAALWILLSRQCPLFSGRTSAATSAREARASPGRDRAQLRKLLLA